jgi:predicted DNA-binding transcriptional regulator AlpA
VQNEPTNAVEATDLFPASMVPLLVGHAEAARLCGISPASWHRLVAAGKIGPAPIRLGGRVLFPVDGLRAWIAAGCPDRQEWQARRVAQHDGRE